jgi:hypothetical protein
VQEADGHTRYSSEGQRDGTSEERQVRGRQEAAAKYGWRLTMLPPERAQSARDGANLEPGTVLGNYEAAAMRGDKRGRVFIAESQNRVSRAKPARALPFLLNLVNNGVKVHFYATGITVDSEAGVRELIQPLIDAEGANKENEERIALVVQSIRIRRDLTRDVFTSRLPDWLTCPKKQRKGELRGLDRITVKRKDDADLIREIFKWTAQGDGGIVIARRLNDLARTRHRYRPWRGKEWTPNVINNLVRNVAVRGHYVPHKTHRDKERPRLPSGKHLLVRTPLPVIKGYYPKIVGDDLWRRAQAARERNTSVKTGRPSRQGVNLFAGLCRCGECGGPMYLTGAGPRYRDRAGQDRVLCPKHKRGGGCGNNGYFGLKRLERGFLANGLPLLAKALPVDTTAADALAARLEMAEREVAAAERATANVRRMMGNAETDEQRAEVQAELAAAVVDKKAAVAARDAAARELENVRGEDPDRAVRESRGTNRNVPRGKRRGPPPRRRADSLARRRGAVRLAELPGQRRLRPQPELRVYHRPRRRRGDDDLPAEGLAEKIGTARHRRRVADFRDGVPAVGGDLHDA